MSKAHAFLSASAAARWIACPPSSKLQEKYEDKGSEYVMTADLPGVQKEDIHLSYDNNVLTLAASHNEQKDSQDEQHNYICKERSSSSFCRQFPVTGIQKEGIQAAFKDGVLTVTLPKDAQQAQPTNTIEIQ